MNEHLRDRLLRKLETLSDERGYQALDYIEFLEARYATKPEAPISMLGKFTDGVEDTLRAGKVSARAIGETMSLLNKAVGVLSGAAAAGKSVASDLKGTANRVVTGATAAATAAVAAANAAATGSTPAAGPTAIADEPSVTAATSTPAADAAPGGAPGAGTTQ